VRPEPQVVHPCRGKEPSAWATFLLNFLVFAVALGALALVMLAFDKGGKSLP